MKLKICELVLYQEHYKSIDDITKICDLYKSIKDYAVILHNKDLTINGDIKKAHYHLMIRFGDSFETDKLLKWFDISANQVEKIKGRFADALLYLTHVNAPNKYQYNLEEVKSNFDFNKESKKVAKKKELERLLLCVANGEIKPYEFGIMIDDMIYIKNERLFTVAYDKFLKKSIHDISRNINVIFITGSTGTGKTTLAKLWCEDRRKSYVVSSSNNDVMQDYKGQDVLILDDMRDSVFKFNDLLKMLDNNVNSSVASRYKNKLFVGDTIILTSSVAIFSWYGGMLERGRFDDLKQFYRRIGLYIVLKENLMKICRIDYDNFELVKIQSMKNPIMERWFKNGNKEDIYNSFVKFGNNENDKNELEQTEIMKELWG